MGEKERIERDFVQLARMAVNQQWEDVRLFVARVLRRYRKHDPELAESLNELLKANPARRTGILRYERTKHMGRASDVDPGIGGELLRTFNNERIEVPLLEHQTQKAIDQLILERKRSQELVAAGLSPSRSAIFEGPPGVGKTLAARWVAKSVGKPLLVLDLATVMSSYLGRTGTNVRSAIEYAKKQDAVLLLDEIDAIAKRRSDDADIGELKRLVTVVLQEVDAWPEDSLLIAATNHAELIDAALWRRFDSIIQFKLPSSEQLRKAVIRYLGNDIEQFRDWVESLTIAAEGDSFSDVEKAMYRFRRSLALKIAKPSDLAIEYLSSRVRRLDKSSQIMIAVRLFQKTAMSQHLVSEITGVARDTIRKHSASKEA